MTLIIRVSSVVVCLAGLLVCCDRPAVAQTWKLTTGGDWNNANNWIGGVVPGDGADVVFPNGLTANAVIKLDKEYKVNSISFLNDDLRFGYRLTADVPGNRNARLTFADKTGVVSVGADNKALQTIDVPVKIDNGAKGLTVTNESAARLAFTKPLAGNAGFLNFMGSGQTILAATGNYQGSTGILGGNVAIASDGALGKSTLITVQDNGTLRGFASASLSAQRAVRVDNGGAALAGDDGSFKDYSSQSKLGNVFDVQAKIDSGIDPRDSLTILSSVRLANTGNSFDLRNGVLLGQSTGEAGFVYIKDDRALGKDSNVITSNNGGIVVEDNVNSGRNIVLAGPTSIEVVGADKTFRESGVVSGALARLFKDGAGTLRLSGTNTYNGDTEVRKGILWVSQEDNLGRSRPLTLGDGTVLRDSGDMETGRPIRLGQNGASIQVDENASLNAKGAISGGPLTKTGKGNLTLAAANSYASTNIREGALLVTTDRNLGAASGSVTLHKDGTLAALDDITTDRELVLGIGARGQPTIFVGDKKTFTLTKGVGGSNNLVKDGGGTLALAKGSDSSVGSDVSVVNGKLRVDGKLRAGGGVFNGLSDNRSRIAGSGIIGPGAFTNKGKVQAGADPGTLTIDDSVTMLEGSTFVFDINDAAGVAGGDARGWGLLSILGSLTLSAPVTIQLETFMFDGQPGPMESGLFDMNQPYSWEFARAQGGIFGFDPTSFEIESAAFLNPTSPDFTFSVGQHGDGLFVNYGPAGAPEPAAVSLFVTGMLVLTIGRRYRGLRRLL